MTEIEKVVDNTSKELKVVGEHCDHNNRKINVLELAMNSFRERSENYLLKDEVERLESQLSDLRKSLDDAQKMSFRQDPGTQKQVVPAFHPDVSVVVSGLQRVINEDHKILRSLCVDIVNAIGGNLQDSIVAVKRVGDSAMRDGLVMIQLDCKENKIKLLQGKMKLSSNVRFSKVFIKSSLPHEVRLMEQNFNTLLNSIPSMN